MCERQKVDTKVLFNPTHPRSPYPPRSWPKVRMRVYPMSFQRGGSLGEQGKCKSPHMNACNPLHPSPYFPRPASAVTSAPSPTVNPLQLSPYSCTNPWPPLRKEKLAKISVGGWEISCLPSPDSVSAAAECGVGSGRKIPDYALLHSSHPIKAQKNRVLQIWPMGDDAHYGPAGPSSM
jgi:hypothetical protein